MKTPLRLCLVLVLMALAQSYVCAQTIDVSLNDLPNVRTGITREFTVTTQGGSGQTVTGKIDFDPYQQNDIVLQYKGPGEQTYTTLTTGTDGVFMFGPESGFAFTATSTVHDFRIFFNMAGNYSYTVSLTPVGGTNAVASVTESVVVTTPTSFPTIDGTLDTYPTLETSNEYIWDIFLNSNEFIGVRGNIQIVLGTVAQRDGITLFYNTNRAAQTEQELDFQPLTFDAQGVATIGPAEGEVLPAEQIRQRMKIVFTQPGTYAYILQFKRDDGTVLASNNESVTVTGVAGIDDMIGSTRISVYPTLANGAVRVDLGDVRNASVIVTDMLGRVIVQLENATGAVNLSTNSMAKGTYFVKVVKGNDVAGSRFVVR